ncbi:LysE family translocator [Ramlibacter sp. WS9]|nr:LysE family translocator [Ramlibacter sp. WS9]
MLFAIADLALKITPGPDMALTLSRGVTQGFRAAWVSALGTSSAGFVHVPLVVLGLATLFSRSPLLFSAVKTAGALYLVYLGVRALFRSRRGRFPDECASVASDREIFLQGFVTNLLNPKVLLFMVVFLPQFADPALGPLWIQIGVLAIYQKASGLVIGAFFGYAASRIRNWVVDNPWFVRAQEGILGATMIGIGGWIVLSRDR